MVPSWLLTYKIFRIVSASASFVLCLLGKRKQRARANNLSSWLTLFCDEFVRCFAFFNPLNNRFGEADRCGSSATKSVINPRRQKQPRKLRRFRTHLLLDPFEVIDGAGGGNELVGHAMIDNNLSATVAETRQIRVVCSDHLAVLLDRL